MLKRLLSSSASERNWAEYKWIRDKKRNRLHQNTLTKLTPVHNELLIEDRNLRDWQINVMKWKDEDIMEYNHFKKSRAVEIKEFLNYTEVNEHGLVHRKNKLSESWVRSKYKCIFFHDNEHKEIRQIVDIEWYKTPKHGELSRYHVVTRLLNVFISMLYLFPWLNLKNSKRCLLL